MRQDERADQRRDGQAGRGSGPDGGDRGGQGGGEGVQRERGREGGEDAEEHGGEQQAAEDRDRQAEGRWLKRFVLKCARCFRAAGAETVILKKLFFWVVQVFFLGVLKKNIYILLHTNYCDNRAFRYNLTLLLIFLLKLFIKLKSIYVITFKKLILGKFLFKLHL